MALAKACAHKAFFVTTIVSIAGLASADWTVVKLHPTGASSSFVSGIQGGVQVGRSNVSSLRASLWSGSANTWVNLHPPGTIDSAINATNGQLHGGYVRLVVNGSSRQHAAIWNGASNTWTDLHPPGPLNSEVSAADDFQQVGSAHSHASLWTGTAASWVDLHPSGATSSFATGVHGGQQVGYVITAAGRRASLWSGSAASWIDLSNGVSSQAFGVHNGQQVGSYTPEGAKESACLWNGTAASLVDLHPAGFGFSRATAVHEGIQVGYVWRPQDEAWLAALWRGSAGTYEDLSASLPSEFNHSRALSVWRSGAVTFIGGLGSQGLNFPSNAVMWVSNEPAPSEFISLLQGIYVSGGLTEVGASDGSYYTAKPMYNVPRGAAPLQIEFEGTSELSHVSILKFRLEAAGTSAGGSQAIALYNYEIGAYDVLDTRGVSGADYKADVVVTENTNRYVHPTTKRMRAKVIVFPPIDASRTWSYRVDEAGWGVTEL